MTFSSLAFESGRLHRVMVPAQQRLSLHGARAAKLPATAIRTTPNFRLACKELGVDAMESNGPARICDSSPRGLLTASIHLVRPRYT